MPELGVLFPHEPDHVIAEQHGGKTTLENPNNPVLRFEKKGNY